MRSDDDSDINRRFDLTRDFPALVLPDRPTLDMESVSSLLVAASEAVPAIREKLDKTDISDDIKMLANFSVNIFNLLEAVVERVIRPLASAPPVGAAAGGRAAPTPPPKPDNGKKELVEALAAAEKNAILHDAFLGTVPIANRQKLCHAFSAGIREAALKRAATDNTDPAEAVRVTDDALSLVKDMTFLGQVSRQVNNPRRPDLDHMSMPIRLEFEDRGARIHFERTMNARCGIRAAMSLPNQVREAQRKFQNAIKDKYPDEIVMVRTDTLGLCFRAFHKEEGGPKWIPCPEMEPIPYNILRTDAKGTARGGGGGGDDAVMEAD
jgi:hypothetical protein